MNRLDLQRVAQAFGFTAPPSVNLGPHAVLVDLSLCCWTFARRACHPSRFSLACLQMCTRARRAPSDAATVVGATATPGTRTRRLSSRRAPSPSTFHGSGSVTLCRSQSPSAAVRHDEARRGTSRASVGVARLRACLSGTLAYLKKRNPPLVAVSLRCFAALCRAPCWRWLW